MRGTTTASAGATATSITVAKPTGTVQYDVILVAILLNQNTTTPGTVTAPDSTWTQDLALSEDNGMGATAVFHKIASASEPAGYGFAVTFGAGTAFSVEAIAASYGNVSAVQPVEVPVTQQFNNSTITPSAPSLTIPAGHNSDELIALFAFGSANITITAPTGMSAENVFNDPTDGATLAWYDQPLSASGATGTRTVTLNAIHTATGVSIALAPGGSPAPTATATATLLATLTPTAIATATRTSTPTSTSTSARTASATPTSTRTASSSATPTATPSPGVPRLSHVFIVPEENHGFSQVIGDPNMPFCCANNGTSLQQEYGLATNYYADTHPSLPNYFLLTSGTIVSSDSTLEPNTCGSACNVPNVFRSLIQARVSWKAYAEDLPSIGYTGGNVGNYEVDHNPAAFFAVNDPVVAPQVNNIVPFQDPNVGFAADLRNNTLPAFAMIIPNLNNDEHNGTDAQADQWLQTNVGPALNSAAFGNGVLAIWWDEGDDNSCSATVTTGCGGQVAFILAGTSVKQSYQGAQYYQHGGALRLIYDALGLGAAPGTGATSNSMSDFFNH